MIPGLEQEAAGLIRAWHDGGRVPGFGVCFVRIPGDAVDYDVIKLHKLFMGKKGVGLFVKDVATPWGVVFSRSRRERVSNSKR